MRITKRAPFALALVALAGIGGGTGYAAWTASSTPAPIVASAGGLDIALDGPGAWASCVVEPDGTVRPVTDVDLANGVQFTQQFDMTLDAGGNSNLDAQLRITNAGSKIPAGHSITYDVLNAAGKVVADDLALTGTGTIPLATAKTGTEPAANLKDWRLVATVTGPKSDAINIGDNPTTVAVERAAPIRLGTFTISLEQTR